MATLPLKSSHNEQLAVIRFCGQKDLPHPPYSPDLTPVTILFLGRWRKCQMGRIYHQIPKCNQSFISGLDSSQHHSLHWAFRSLLTNGTNVRTNLDNMSKNETLMFNI